MSDWMSTRKEMPGIGKNVKLKLFNGRVLGLCELYFISEGELLGWYNMKTDDKVNACDVTEWKYLTPSDEIREEHWLDKYSTPEFQTKWLRN
jgi:hypothetical protein